MGSLNKTLMEQTKFFDADVIVIGSSIASQSVIQQLKDTSLRVLVLEGGDVVMVVLPRERLDYTSLNPGDRLHITTRQTRTFEPDYAI